MAEARMKNRRSTRRRRNASLRIITRDEESAEELLNEELLSDVEPEEILRRIEIQKDVIATVKNRPWPMSKKIRVLKQARDFVEKYEGRLSKRTSYREAGKELWKKANRFYKDICTTLTPWDKRIKTVESYFGSSVASYFTFLRWLVYINVVMGIVSIAFVVIPEILVGKMADYKTIAPSKIKKAWDLETIWALGGYLEHSVLFYGYYTSDNTIGNGYRLPLAYFLVGIAIFAYSFIALLRKMAKNSRASGNDGFSDDFTFSWKLFCSWDYMIGNSETAENKSAAIATAFREAIVEEQEKEKDKDNRKTLLIFLRVVANIIVLLVLAGSLYSIQNAVTRSQNLSHEDREKTFWEQNEVGVIVTLVTMITPSLFEMVGQMEQYHPRNTLRIQLARILMLYLGNLYSLMIGLLQHVTAATEGQHHNSNVTLPEHQARNFLAANSAQNKSKRAIYNASVPFPNLLSVIEEKENVYKLMLEAERNASLMLLNRMKLNATAITPVDTTTVESQTEPMPVAATECWETFVGQELMKLTIIDLISTILTVLIIDYIRALIVRYMNFCCCWDLERKFPEYGEFKIAENILHLIYNQGVTWIGSFFCPLLPAVNVLKLTLIMYLRSWAVVTCNVPHTRVFRASGSNFYLVMLLFMLFLSLLPTMWVIMQCPPSNCGPFRNKERMHAVLTETLEDVPDWMRSAITHLSTPVVMLPAVLLLLMVIYYLQAIARSAKESNSQLRMQLQYERKEGRKTIFKMGAGKKKGAETAEEPVAKIAIPSKEPAGPLRKKDSKRSNASSAKLSQIVENKLPIMVDKGDGLGDDMLLSPRRCTPKPARRKDLNRRHSSKTSFDCGSTLERKRRHDSTVTFSRHESDDLSTPQRRSVTPMEYNCSPTSIKIPVQRCEHSPYATLPCRHAEFHPQAIQHAMQQQTHLAFATRLDLAGRPTSLFLQPNAIQQVPYVLMPHPAANPVVARVDTNQQAQDGMLYAHYDPITGAVGNIVQETAVTSQSREKHEQFCAETVRQPGQRKNSSPLVRQANVSNNERSSCDTSDAASDAEGIIGRPEVNGRMGKLPSCDSGRCSQDNRSET